MNEQKIVMLSRDILHPHPDNPRKDLGDLEELKESIRENGVMQNLTVVPDHENDGYKILIGHRRFAASEGILDKLPCIVVKDLTDREQVGIMLAENMQRADLTVMEQAHGFQMMLDLGDTIETISQKTGFSQKTVKHRIEINKLDKDAIAEAMNAFQLTISDYIELEKVKDIDARNEILRDSCNSEDLKDEVESWLREQLFEENKKKYVEVFEELGWKEASDRWFNYGSKWEHVSGLGYIYLDKFEPDQIRKAAKTIKGEVYYSNLKGSNSINFALKVNKKDEKTKKKTKAEIREEKINKQQSQLESARADICDEYYKFIISIPKKKLDAFLGGKQFTTFSRLWRDIEKLNCNISTFSSVYNIKSKNKQWDELEAGYESLDLIQRVMLQVWRELASTYSHKFTDWEFIKNEDVLDIHQDFYDILRYFGLRLDAELESVIDGTSELYLIDGKEVIR